VKLLSSAMVAALAAQSALAVTLPFTDHFDYNEGMLTAVSGGNWVAGSAGLEISVSNAAALTAPPSLETASGKGVKLSTSGTARRALAQFAGISSGSVYASFLLNVQSGSSPQLIAYFENLSSQQSTPQLGVFASSSSIVVGKKSSSGVTTSVGSGTHFVVVRYTFLAGNDQADLWVDPSSGDYGATTPPLPLGSTTGGSDPTSIQYFALNTPSSAGSVIASIDEVRIGTSWADVTPRRGSSPPPPLTNLMVTSAFAIPAGIVLRGAGGSPTGLYEVVSATDLSVGVSHWSTIATNFFDIAGNFDCTNPISTPNQFFSIHAGITNSGAPPPGAPVIVSQPQSLSILSGQAAMFSVIATGSPPLFYQWYLDTNSPLPDATNPTLTATSPGVYSAVVSNAAGSVASDFAALTVSSLTNYDLVGFATLDGGTTGGGNAATVTVNNATAFEAAMNSSSQLVIQVAGKISFGTLDTKPNKTILGLGPDATISGNLKLTHTSNIIVRNITFDTAPDDLITVQNSTHIWIDHCTFINAGDGELDITHASDWVTVSWCKFLYTFNSGHNFVNLIGHDDANAVEDTGHLRVTWHHNWWSTLCIERMPRVRFGQVHSFDNYFNPSVGGSVTNHYCARAAIGSQLLIENNFFENVRTPWEVYITSAGGPDGLILATNNNVGFLDTSYGVEWGTTTTNSDHTIDVIVPGTNTVFTPPYSYPLEAVLDVPSLLTNNVGAGKGPFAP
jgi:pectate lyase